MSIGYRVVMLNAIQDNIPNFYFPFYKAPKAIILEIVKLQCAFLWGGMEVERKVN